jgi:Na+/proline symporter
VYFAAKGLTIKPDDVFGAVARGFLPKVTPGILGVFIASLVGSVMSACSALMLASSALFTENIYKALKPAESQRHYVAVGRISAVLVVGGGVLFARVTPDVVKALEVLWMVSPVMGIVFWLGLFWRRTTPAGAWAATLTALCVWLLSSQTVFGSLHSFVVASVGRLPCADTLKVIAVKCTGPEICLPWQIIFYLSAGCLAGIVVSLFTKPISEERLDKFYALVRTPIRPGEQVPAPCTLPLDVVIPRKRAIFPDTSLEILVPSRTSVAGFVVSWFVVFLMVYLSYRIVGGF